MRLFPFKGSYESLLKLTLNKYVNVSHILSETVKDPISDMQCPIIFSNNLGNYRIICGPIKKEPAIEKMFGKPENIPKELLDIKTSIPEISLLVDIDYWNNPDLVFNSNELTSLLREFDKYNASNAFNIHNLVLGTK